LLSSREKKKGGGEGESCSTPEGGEESSNFADQSKRGREGALSLEEEKEKKKDPRINLCLDKKKDERLVWAG